MIRATVYVERPEDIKRAYDIINNYKNDVQY